MPASSRTSAPSKEKTRAGKKSESDKEIAEQLVASSTRTKRKRDELELEQDDVDDKTKRARRRPAPAETSPKKPPVLAKPTPKIAKRINQAPTAPLDIFVFGEGAGGELGLGSKPINNQSPRDVMRPRLNTLLSADDVGLVQISCGGLHAIALTKDNKILTWGVNDQGALGRETNSEEDDDDLCNPSESTPARVDTSGLDPNIRWAQVIGSDNASFALTEDGRVYGWGTFRGSEGIMGFREIRKKPDEPEVQKTPRLIPELKNITQLAAGNNHVLALDNKGGVFAWGCGEQYPLGRAVRTYHPESALRPASIGRLPRRGSKAVKVACGSYHSFALDQDGRVFAWGLNNFAELAIPDQAGESNACQMKPRLVESLKDHNIVDIAGGEHHSLAVTSDGKLLTWGRIDGYRVGLRSETFTKENTIFDERGKPRILIQPTIIPDMPPVVAVAAGTDHSFVLTADGKTYSWGFSSDGRTGQGTEDDIEVPTLINSRSVRDKKLIFAGAGGPFSILASVAGTTG
ncbi:RCC1/BLIP-II [Hypoxylon crocopeplum]|nr:RCC1/BLIP-II [Hypoxylon crocopeplum]